MHIHLQIRTRSAAISSGQVMTLADLDRIYNTQKRDLPGQLMGNCFFSMFACPLHGVDDDNNAMNFNSD